MKCHDNAVFDISWSSDDYKLVHPPSLMSNHPPLCALAVADDFVGDCVRRSNG